MADKTAFDYVNEIWSIANYVRDVIRPADYMRTVRLSGDCSTLRR